uniref:Uncharacterized protein n=1 Tax=Schizaphis graminum TaxID=13262 RepID=A0A2S2N8F1_SCHGA
MSITIGIRARVLCSIRAHRVQYYTHTHTRSKRISLTRDEVIIIIIIIIIVIIIRIMVIDSVPNSNLYNCERRKTDAEPVGTRGAFGRFAFRVASFRSFFLNFTDKVL